MKKIIKYFMILAFFLWIVVLPIRSAIYVGRIIEEFTKSPSGLFATIDECSDEENLRTFEEERMYRYKSLGTECEK